MLQFFDIVLNIFFSFLFPGLMMRVLAYWRKLSSFSLSATLASEKTRSHELRPIFFKGIRGASNEK